MATMSAQGISADCDLSSLGNLTGCFAKNLDRLHKGQRQRAVCFKFTFGLISDEGERFVRCINHVLQANDVRLEHTALRRRLGPLCGNIGSGPERYGDPPYGYPATWRVLARFERLPENLVYVPPRNRPAHLRRCQTRNRPVVPNRRRRAWRCDADGRTRPAGLYPL